MKLPLTPGPLPKKLPKRAEGGPAAFGLGLAALGRPGYINLSHGRDLSGRSDPDALREHTFAVLDLAWQKGVRYFDTARSYGRGEEFLGAWLASRAPQPVFVASKWGYTYTADWQADALVHEVKDHTRQAFERQWPETRLNLGRAPDLYQIHSATLESGVLEQRDTLRALFELRAAGVRVGLSVSGPLQPKVIERALEVEVDGEKLFEAVQATFNLLETSAESALRNAHEAGLLVVVKESLANGRLASPDTGRREDVETLARLEAEAERLGITCDALALAWVAAHPFVDVVLSGAATGHHLISNLQAQSCRPDEVANEVLRSLAESSAAYWSTRATLPWQ